ncbi:hypothetical protein ACZ81_14575 [Alteromonas macleodii]|nr:hypothetical protein ACZ81_14575 [Alteromonas macleodii]HAD89552.1 hypothetical protein [Alteromonas macleodii]
MSSLETLVRMVCDGAIGVGFSAKAGPEAVSVESTLLDVNDLVVPLPEDEGDMVEEFSCLTIELAYTTTAVKKGLLG